MLVSAAFVVCASYSTPAFSLKFLQDLVSAVVQILVHRGRLQGWKPERMGDISLGVKLLAEQMCSELKPSGRADLEVLEYFRNSDFYFSDLIYFKSTTSPFLIR